MRFNCYAKSNAGGTSGLLLHSSEHPTINHTAREDDNSVENHLKHYVAIFNPETGKLQVTEARRLVVRSAIRVRASAQEDEGEEAHAPATNSSSRAALTAAFGTKKSKTAARSVAENRLLAQGTDEQNRHLADAMLSHVAEEEEFQKVDLTSEALRNKPLPPADLDTDDIDQVYSLETLVVPSSATATLKAMPIQPWTGSISAKQEIHSRYRFIANRVGFLVRDATSTPDDKDGITTKRLQVLKYIEFLLDLHAFFTRLPKRKPIPPADKWPEETMSTNTPVSLLRPVVKHFFPERIPKDQAVTLLRTTILALTLHIPPSSKFKEKNILVAEPTDISMDMAVEANEVRKLYRELGCQVAPAAESDLGRWGLEKLSKARKDRSGNTLPKPVFAKLKLPLSFPKLSRGQSTRRK